MWAQIGPYPGGVGRGGGGGGGGMLSDTEVHYGFHERRGLFQNFHMSVMSKTMVQSMADDNLPNTHERESTKPIT